MNIPNLQLPADVRLDPDLETLVYKLSLAKPDWFFHPPKNPSFSRLALANRADAPEGIRFLREIVVYQKDRVAGRIEVDAKWNKKQIHYELISHRLHNGRMGSRTRTINIAKAVLIAKKYFSPHLTSELMYKELDRAKSDIRSTVSRLCAELHTMDVSRTAFAIQMQKFIRSVLIYNEQPDPTVTHELRTALSTEQYETALSHHLLGRAMASREYVLVTVIDGEYCMFAGDKDPTDEDEARKSEVLCVSFEMLPLDIQNKLAVLQLMEDGELVLDVGFRHSSDSFLIVQ